MIIPILGNVTYQITLDPSVWIFDDRKILFEEAFKADRSNTDQSYAASLEEQAAKRWNRALYPDHIKPPVNRSISRMEGKKILENSYVIPLYDFVRNAELMDGATEAIVETTSGDEAMSINQLINCYMLFSWNGRQIKDEGPAHLYFKDGSNKQNPIKGIKKIRII